MKSLDLRGGGEAIATADGCDLQVYVKIARQVAFINHILRGLMRLPDLNQNRRTLVMLAEVGAQATLAVVNLQHDGSFRERA